MTNPLSTSWQAILIQNTMENGEGERDEISCFHRKESTKNDCFIILIIALCQMTGHQWTKKMYIIGINKKQFKTLFYQ